MKITNTAQKSLVAIAALIAIGAGAGLTAVASAQGVSSTTGAGTTQAATGKRGGMGPGVMGTLSAISGDTLTVTAKDGKTYTVDATNAKVLTAATGAAPTTGSISDLKVGDTVSARGTLSGTTLTATEVMDGVFPHGHGMGGPGGFGHGVQGKVTAVNGSTLTITNTDGTSYTVDASSAQVSKVVSLQVSDIQVGDTVAVQGKVSGQSVTASHIMDGVPPTPQAPPGTTTTTN